MYNEQNLWGFKNDLFKILKDERPKTKTTYYRFIFDNQYGCDVYYSHKLKWSIGMLVRKENKIQVCNDFKLDFGFEGCPDGNGMYHYMTDEDIHNALNQIKNHKKVLKFIDGKWVF